MASEGLLTKDEMDALLEEVANRRADIASEADEGAVPYALASPENTVAGLLPILANIHERFAHRLRIGLFELLRRDVEVAVEASRTRSFSDLGASLSAPCSVNLIAAPPLAGPGLLIFEQPLVFLVVDTFFGGKGLSYGASSSHEFTATELRLIQRLEQLAFHCLEAAWQPFATVKCAHLGAESNPQFVTAVNPREVLVVASLRLELDDSAGTLHLALPCSAFEPVREALLASLSKAHPTPSERLAQLLREGVKESRIGLRAVLAETELSMRELLSLKPGDVVPVEITPRAVLEAEGVPVYAGPYGIAQGCRALKIEQALAPLEGEMLTDTAVR